MNYFPVELWYKSCSGDRMESEAAMKELEERSKAYMAYLDKIAKKIPRNTMKAINQIARGDLILHDATVAGIVWSNAEFTGKIGRPRHLKRICRLQLTNLIDCEEDVEIVMSDVKRMLVDASYWEDDRIQWGYCEFSHKKPNIVLSVFVHTGHVWEFEFSTLSIIYTKSNEGILWQR